MDNEFKFGAIPSEFDIRDYRLKFKVAKVANYPDTFGIVLPKPKNQGNVNACVAFTLALIAEYHNSAQNYDDSPMSTNCIYLDRRNSLYKGEGMVARDGCDNYIKVGVCSYDSFPGNNEVPEGYELFNKYSDEIKDESYSHRGSEYFRLKGDLEIKEALSCYGPVMFVIPWFNDTRYSDGILDSEKREYDNEGYHAITIYGWTPEGWLMQNSWGKYWGKNGRAVLPFDYPVREIYGFTDNIVESENSKIVVNFKTKFGKWIASILNKIFRLINKLINKLK